MNEYISISPGLFIHHCGAQANSASYPSPVSKREPASAWKAKAGIVHSICW